MVQSFAFYDDIVQKKYLYIYMKIKLFVNIYGIFIIHAYALFISMKS